MTKGEGLLSSAFEAYVPYKGTIDKRNRGGMISMENGTAMAYSLWNLQERGMMFIEPQTEVYEGMIIGESSKPEDLSVNVTKNKKGGKVLSEEDVDVIFEETETKAKKVIYDFTGAKSLLAGMSGGKTLTIYYVACKVRENYVSCCMSFWNNDTITESGLAPLLDKVMKIKK